MCPDLLTAVSGRIPIARHVTPSFDGLSSLLSGRCTVRDAFDVRFPGGFRVPMNPPGISEYEGHDIVV